MADEKPLPEKPLPVINEESRPFWEGCKAGKLMLRHCADCGAWVYYPRALCPKCHGERLPWEEASGRGVIYAYTVCHRPAGPAFAEDVPYVVALIDLEEGARMLSNIVTEDPASVRIGQEVRVTFEARNEEVTLPLFAPA